MAQHLSHLHFPLLFLITICLCVNSTFAGKSQNFYPFFKVDTDGTVHRYEEIKFVPPSNNPRTGVQSKDVTILREKNVSARLYLPKICGKNQKFPLLFYIHGGGFCTQSAFSSRYDSYLHKLTAEANVVAVSIDYRLAPEHPIPACYDDSWAVLNWAAQGTEPWLKEHANFSRVFLAGDSAGADIAHNLMVRASEESHFLMSLVGMALVDPYFGNGKLDGLWTYLCPKSNGIDDSRFNPAAHPRMLAKLNCSKILVCTAGKDFLKNRAWTYYETLKKNGWKGDSAGANIAHNMMMRASVDEDKLGDGLRLVGMALIQPYFGNNEPDRIWSYCCPENPKTDDPRCNPAAHPSLLSKLVCSNILICTGGKDFIRDRGWTYYEALKKCGWKGHVEIKETEGEEHVFHLVNPTCEKAKELMKLLADFFQQSS